MNSARDWEARVRRLDRHTPQDPAVLESLRQARQQQAAGDRALERYLGRLPYGAKGCNEDVEHRAFILWVQRDGLDLFPALQWLHHSPNEAAWRGQAGKGVRRGWPDFVLPVRVAGFAGAAAELKGPGGAPSADQREWLRHLSGQGYAVVVPNGFECCRSFFVRYLQGEL